MGIEDKSYIDGDNWIVVVDALRGVMLLVVNHLNNALYSSLAKKKINI